MSHPCMGRARTSVLLGLLLCAAVPGVRGEEKAPLSLPSPIGTKSHEKRDSTPFWMDASKEKRRKLRQKARDSREEALKLLRAGEPQTALQEAERRKIRYYGEIPQCQEWNAAAV